MRLQKIQKFLKENNIDYKYSISKTSNNEFGEIDIKSDKTVITSICEITGNRGNKPSGIMVFYFEKENNSRQSYTTTSQAKIIERIERDLQGGVML